MKPKQTIIYCLKNPIDRNRVFYVGRTTCPLKVRLAGHLSNQTNRRMREIIKAIKEAGKIPSIHQLEVCKGYLAPMLLERYWVKHYNKREYKLANAPFSCKIVSKEDRVYW